MTAAEAFLVRSPLLGKDSRFAGYFFRSTQATGLAPYRQLFAAMGAGRSPGGTLMVEDLDPALDEAAGEIPEGVTVVARAGRGDRVGHLQALRVGVCARVDAAPEGLPASAAAAGWLWLDAGASTPLRNLARAAQRLPGRRLMGGITSRDVFEDARELGGQLFEGDWYRRVAGTGQKAVAPGQATVLELINLTRNEAPAAEIEQVLKRDATLSVRLLRYINSAGVGLSCEIQSFRHAVTILGYQNLGRWLALLLATAGSTAAAPVLMREAAVRGRLTEILGESLIAPEERDNLFIVGVFSLLPAILQMPMDRLVDQLHLSDTVNDALTQRSGLYGPILRLAESVEAPHSDALSEASAAMAVPASLVNRQHLEALAWASQLAA